MFLQEEDLRSTNVEQVGEAETSAMPDHLTFACLQSIPIKKVMNLWKDRFDTFPSKRAYGSPDHGN